MTIYWDFATETVTRIDEDGNEVQTDRRGELQVWFHSSDPGEDAPNQTYDWRAADEQLTVGAGPPDAVTSVCASREIDTELTQSGSTLYLERIQRDIALGNIRRKQ